MRALGEDIAMMPEFVCGDVTGEALRGRVSTELSEAAVVWANDFTWGEEAQRVVEDMALDSMPDGAVMVR